MTNLDRFREDERIFTSIISSLPKSLHDFYDAIEELIFERIVEETQEGKPTGTSSYTLLLRNMTLEIEGIRPQVISSSTAERLLEYLRFRHVFRHTYGFDLDLDKFIHLAKGAKEVFFILSENIENFFKSIG